MKEENKLENMSLDQKFINSIRVLSMDAVQKANSGHPGTPMALAPCAYVLWKDFMKYNPKNPNWFNRDRFVLSCGHASLLQYSVLHLTGYDISLDDIKNFRQWESNTPGHPERGLTPGIETTTGPLGQGIMTAVGMAMAEAHLGSVFNKSEKIIDHFTYAICSDGDLMEGASHEAASIAGHLGLGKLICVYDNNHITIEGHTPLSYNDDPVKRFEAYHWHVQEIKDGNDLDAISEAFKNAQGVVDRPSMIVMRTHIGYGAPNKQDTPGAHGSPLGEEEIKKTKAFYGFPEDKKFFVPEAVQQEKQSYVDRGQKWEAEWNETVEKYKQSHSQVYDKFQQYLKQDLPEGWDKDVPSFTPKDGPKATREINATFLNAVAENLPWLMGGSADLEPSTKTMIKSSDYFERNDFSGRNIAWGIREHGMCAASSGLYVHGGIRPYASTFFIFTDYARPAIRLACVMKIPVIYVMTHDSIGLGEDGTTHQPIEQLASFRAMPQMTVIRPADANETNFAWRAAIQRTDGPTMLVLTRQKLPIFDQEKVGKADGVYKGAYILSKEKGDRPDMILMATGSEVQLIMEAQKELEKDNIHARVVSMPSWEMFREQSQDYKDSVLDPSCSQRLAIEAGASQGWLEWIGPKGDMIGIDHYGESAPAEALFEHFGFTVAEVVKRAKALKDKQ